MEGGKNVNSALSLSQKAASYVSRNFVYRDDYGAKKSNLWKIDIRARAGVERHLARFPSSSISGVNPEHIFCIVVRHVMSSRPTTRRPTDRTTSLPLEETEEGSEREREKGIAD